jgi:ATP-binding cassette subfamily B (MDR/TAP) protein 8
MVSLNARPLFQGLLTFGYLVLLSHIGERMAMDMRKALFSSLLRY